VPWHAKAVAAIVAAYALSPIDLIPDFVPVLGYLDDLIIVPLGIWLAVHLIPSEVMAEHLAAAAADGRPTSTGGAVAIALVWLAAILVATRWAWGCFSNRPHLVDSGARLRACAAER
jgi:uncharacterized membrane protein YkvA (DUF1232 family)